MTGAWVKGIFRRRIEFIKFKPGSPADGHVVIGHFEQGLLANLFSDLIGDADCIVDWRSEPEVHSLWMCELRRAATTVGFPSFEQVRAFRDAHAHRDDFGELLAAYTRSIR